MGQERALEFSGEEERELSIRLLRDWWINSTRALVDIVGSEEALRNLKPYYINAGHAGAINFKKMTGLATEDAGSLLAIWIGIINHLLSDLTVVVKAHSRDYAVAEITDCRLRGISPEVCYCLCVYCNEGGRNLNPSYQTELVKCTLWGDDICCFKASPPMGTEPEGGSIATVPIPTIPIEMADYLQKAYYGELWVNATRASIDAMGSKNAMEMLCAEMKISGQGFARKLALTRPLLDGPGSIIHWLCTLHQKKEFFLFDQGDGECTVTECPFSEAPPEICLQYEAFFDGICKSINPDYEFVYDRMMTIGDKNCHWTIKKRGEMIKPKAEASYEDPTRALALRFGRGEISLEDFEKGMESLRKHGIMK